LKTYNIYYSQSELQSLPLKKINKAKSILIQIFSGKIDQDYLNIMIDEIKDFFPKAVLIGSTTDGEILDSNVTTNEVVISITTFKKSKISSYYIENIEKIGSFKAGKKLAKKLIQKNSKAMIVFSDGLKTNGEEMLNGISSVSDSVVVAGGLAGGNAQFQHTYVITNDGAKENCAVGVILNSDELYIQSDYKLNCQPIGKKLKITHAEGNRVYSIDSKLPVDIYRHYLGDAVYKELPKTGVEFPLILQKNGMTISRAVLAKHDDGSLSFAGNMEAGEYYQFGFANSELMQDDTKRIVSNLSKHGSESIFIYSCMARRRFYQDFISSELSPLVNMATISGFFTYGEFFHQDKQSSLMNQTMTILSLSETQKTNFVKSNIERTVSDNNSSTMTALSHLISVSSSELEEIGRVQKVLSISPLINNGPVVNFQVECNSFNKVKFISSNIISLLEYSSEEFLNGSVNILELIHKDDKKMFFKGILDAKKDKIISFEKEIRLISKNKKIKHIHCFLSIERSIDKSKDSFHGYMIDITKRKLSEEKIKYLAYNDSLTMLSNRTFLENRLQKSIKKAEKNSKNGVLLFLDLNRFKNINDTLGHGIGDKVLQVVAKRLTACVGENGLVSRIGGDEFVILIDDLKYNCDFNSIKLLSQNIYKSIEAPINIKGHTLYISTSIGASIYPKDSNQVDEILKFADSAMYLAKKDKNSYLKFYNSSINSTLIDDFTIENDLRKALINKEFSLLYQPQIDINSGLIVGAEALIRWNHPKKGMIPPDNFISIAEETGQIIAIGEWVLRTACEKIKYLQLKDNLPMTFKKISVNISSVQFKQDDFVDKVMNIILSSGIDAAYLELELTEGALIDYIEDAIDKINILKKTGLSFSIDDFGTGYSSLAYLKKFPIDILKIDKSFVSDMDHDHDDAVLTETIIQMSKNLHLGVIAEGVEKIEHVDFLRQRGCETYQGYYFSKPISFDAFKKLLFQEEDSISKMLLIKV
jgi:diguanylate cyclase (GGDEF)-like protein